MAANPLQFPKLNPRAWLMGLAYNNVGILTNAGAPTSGTSGTGVNKAGPGCLLIDITASVGKLYINTGTLTSPTWTVVGTQS
jgi:hypothetical protein